MAVRPGSLATSSDFGEAPVCLVFDRPIFEAQAEMEGGQRVVYMEASTEVRDLQGEKVLLSALEASIPYFLKYGRIDLDHASVLGQIRGNRVNPYAFEIGKPLDVRIKDGSVWVKAAIFSATGDNRFTEAADIFWDSLQTNPPVTWFPSIAGEVYSEEATVQDGKATQEIRGLRWHSIGLSRTPVNPKVAPVTTVPVRAFAKAFSGMADMKELLGILKPINAPQQPFSPVMSGTGVDVLMVKKAMDALLEADQSEAGIDGYLTLAKERGVPDEIALALLTVLMSNKK
jgi:hypothetical protein